MKKILRRTGWLVAAAMVPLLLGFGSCKKDLNPIIFVHGYSGSGAQFESQAMRFASNGYPTNYIAVIEYDSGLTFPDEIEVVHGMIDAQIAEFQAELGADQVDLMGHSRGTTVSHDYLSFPDRAANVAHYVNIDGRTADAPPGGVPTLALWAGAVERPVWPEIVGAINVTVPDQEHVEVATSEESFLEM
jgi:pimeloyl-ACP methyl ester carboxylesterase